MIRKKRGLGAGKINGVGGRLKPGELPLAGILREAHEELRITLLTPSNGTNCIFNFWTATVFFARCLWRPISMERRSKRKKPRPSRFMFGDSRFTRCGRTTNSGLAARSMESHSAGSFISTERSAKPTSGLGIVPSSLRLC